MSRTETEFAFGADGYTPHPTFQGVPPPPPMDLAYQSTYLHVALVLERGGGGG